MEQINATYVKMTYARMSDIPTFDTNTAIWNFNNATGNLPIYRRRHVAVLGIDGISIIVCCGGKDNSDDAFNDVFVLNTQTWQWSGANVVGSAPSPRRSLPSIIVNGHIILLFGRTGGDDTAISSDIGILDTRTTPFQWTTSFSPNPPVSSSIATTTTATTTTTNVLTTNGTSNEIAAGALGVVIGIICGFLAILAILFFLIIGMPWRTHAQNNPPQDPRSESSPAPSLHAIDKSEVQASNSDSCQESAPQLPVRAQGQAVDMSNPSMNSAITFSHGGTVTVVKLARRGTTTTANQSADSYSTPAGSFRPPIQSIQNRCGDQPGGSVNQQIQLAIPDTSTNFLVPPAQSLQNS
ncbi:hypothetical protein BC938DRAFT_483775 [Jimgerdemannia flammicorona]|uniref:Uncharacterized protein n=1 Tax=Jimgerdemannia flammicorona TaxID=994334 RepID=A0A433QB88_9FUNG|nr:hypothetical protein BC938DRAFT_483775 [Jimgerdemannia flammicorona]